jgi:hypothetical protein
MGAITGFALEGLCVGGGIGAGRASGVFRPGSGVAGEAGVSAAAAEDGADGRKPGAGGCFAAGAAVRAAGAGPGLPLAGAALGKTPGGARVAGEAGLAATEARAGTTAADGDAALPIKLALQFLQVFPAGGLSASHRAQTTPSLLRSAPDTKRH